MSSVVASVIVSGGGGGGGECVAVLPLLGKSTTQKHRILLYRYL